MAYKHGIYTSEQATSLSTMTSTDSGLIIAVGTAPVHLASSAVEPNTPVLCYTYAEAVEAFGYSKNWKNYTLCEVIKEQFSYYNMAPIVLINVLNTDKHRKSVTKKDISVSNKEAVIEDDVILATLKISADGAEAVPGTDYTAEYDDDGNVLVTVIDGGALASAITIDAEYSAVDPTKVDKDDIIGGIDVTTGKKEGFELVDEIYPRFGLVPGILIAPGFSCESSVAAVMAAKTYSICSIFNAIAVCDIPCDEDGVTKYSEITEWKNNHGGFADKNVVACWPMVKLDDEISHLSTHLASLMNKTDAAHDDIPYYAPSNKSLQIDGACLGDGTEVYMTLDQANFVNGQGVSTVLNFNGLKAWGVQTAAYTSSSDVKDTQIVNRRMFNWVGNTLVTSFWSKIDEPTNRRHIESIVDSANIWLNGLVSKGALLGGRVEFREDENTTTNLMDGKTYFHVYMTPPAADREIHFVQEYDPDYISTLFE